MHLATTKYLEDFLGHQKLALVADGRGTEMAYIYDKTNATPTVAGLTNSASGVVQLLLDNTNEAQGAGIYHGDICCFKADDLQTVTFRLNMTANCTTAQSLVWGMISARNSNPDTPTYNVQFKLAASTTIVLETDDNATDNDDKSSEGGTLGTTMKEFMIDFRQGLTDIRF